MCSRYEIRARPEALARRFRLDETAPDLARPEVRPTDPAPIVVRDEGGVRRARAARFGLNVTWDKMPVINARAETLRQKPTFRPLLGNRCVVPASAYFEWRQDGRARRRNRISLANEELIGFAGLFDADRFVIITCAPAATIAHVHDRMPVILPPESEERWLDRTNDDLARLLSPYAGAIAAAEEKPRPSPQGDLFAFG
ncbi:MAG: SOS response-associated peptidase [Alphaproteobacteria bacterium]|nr:SOS response-associated peptidase [Alphaproteobacteria bacterium]MBM3732542.1 SOS response-associated peptidase [Acidimicrobiia bacterium]